MLHSTVTLSIVVFVEETNSCINYEVQTKPLWCITSVSEENESETNSSASSLASAAAVS